MLIHKLLFCHLPFIRCKQIIFKGLSWRLDCICHTEVNILILEVRGAKELPSFWVGGVTHTVAPTVKISVYVSIIDVMLRPAQKRSGTISLGSVGI